MKQFSVTGMSCAACSARVEKAVSKVEGVTSCSVNLLTNSMNVEGDVTPEAIIKAVTEAGYGANEKREMFSNGKSEDKSVLQGESEDTETLKIRKRLLVSLVFLMILMYFSMGHNMWGWSVPGFFENNPVALGLLQMILAAVIMMINQRFFISGFKSLSQKAPNMDTLVALGSGTSFGYSVYILFEMTDHMTKGNARMLSELKHEFYFESAAMILTLITVGKMLESYSKGRTTDALKSLMKLSPETATVLRNQEELTIPAADVMIGDIFVVRPGESIPVDGVVLEGSSAVNESALTGESIPVDKEKGAKVSTATINQSGFLKCQATRVGEDTALAQIIKRVSEASATKAPIAKIADKVSGVFVPVVLLIAVITIFTWLFIGESVGFALARGISVLVISCPCALGLATPVAIMVGNGVGAKNGILYKNAEALETVGKVKVVALDKTGTITKGEPMVTDIIPVNGHTEKELIILSASIERKSEHPLGKALVRYAKEKGFELLETSYFETVTGSGIKAHIGENILMGGSQKFVSQNFDIDRSYLQEGSRLSECGKTPLYFVKNGSLMGILALSDTVKDDSIFAVRELKNMGINVVMITGDNENTAKAIGKTVGLDETEVIAGVLPEGKENAIQELKKYGKVAMVGDGINDAPALATADVGIAIGAGTDVAIDSADVVLMKSKLIDVPKAIKLGKCTLKNIKENLFWAFFYNSVGIPLAAGMYYNLLGWKLSPMFGAAAMSLSSFCVVTNALRLNFVRLDQNKDLYLGKVTGENSRVTSCETKGDSNKKKLGKKEDIAMTKTLKIEGMMCQHCEARVKKTLEAFEQVDVAEVSHENGTAVVTLNQPVEDSVLKEAVENQDYKVISIE